MIALEKLQARLAYLQANTPPLPAAQHYLEWNAYFAEKSTVEAKIGAYGINLCPVDRISRACTPRAEFNVKGHLYCRRSA